MKELVSFIVARLVDQPEAVVLEEREDGDTVVVELRVAKEDLGKVIGKQGRTIRSVRALVSAAASREGKRATVEVVD